MIDPAISSKIMIFAIALFLTTSTLAPLTFGAEDGEDLAFEINTGDLQGIKCTGSLQWFFPLLSIFSSVFVMQLIIYNRSPL